MNKIIVTLLQGLKLIKPQEYNSTDNTFTPFFKIFKKNTKGKDKIEEETDEDWTGWKLSGFASEAEYKEAIKKH